MKAIPNVNPTALRTKTKSTPVPPEEFLTTGELMRLLKVKHKQTIYSLIQEGLPGIRIGATYRYLKSEVIAFLMERTNYSVSRRKKGKNGPRSR